MALENNRLLGREQMKPMIKASTILERKGTITETRDI